MNYLLQVHVYRLEEEQLDCSSVSSLFVWFIFTCRS